MGNTQSKYIFPTDNNWMKNDMAFLKDSKFENACKNYFAHKIFYEPVFMKPDMKNSYVHTGRFLYYKRIASKHEV